MLRFINVKKKPRDEQNKLVSQQEGLAQGGGGVAEEQ